MENIVCLKKLRPIALGSIRLVRGLENEPTLPIIIYFNVAWRFKILIKNQYNSIGHKRLQKGTPR